MPAEQSPFDLAGRAAFVTGSTHIIGPELCDALAQHGARVAVVDLDEEAAQRLAKDLEGRHGTDALALGCDVADEAAVQRAVAAALDAFGHLDVLVNGAATKTPDFYAPLEAYPLEDFRRVLDVNLTGAFLCAKHVVPAMKRRGRGSIINIASVYGLVGPDPRIYEAAEWQGRRINTPPAYAASKAGLVGLTRWLATTLGPHGIRANAIAPGGVESGQSEAFVRAYSARTMLGRMAQASELRGAAVFLASDASAYVTGTTVVVDGGWTAW